MADKKELERFLTSVKIIKLFPLAHDSYYPRKLFFRSWL
jgi:hypothetical protein